MIRVHGLCCCVNYSQYLQYSGLQWIKGLQSLTVVSDNADELTHRTVELLSQYPRASVPVTLHKTDLFYEYGASFNKGAAMEQARKYMPWEDWILFFDVDVVPHPDWNHFLPDALDTEGIGYLYGAKRMNASTLSDVGRLDLPAVNDDRVGYGYFQLFHSKDPKLYMDIKGQRVLRVPVLDTHWKHAGNYDSNFLLQFGPLVREIPIFPLWHIGPQHENWFGVGQQEKFQEMMARRGGHGIHESEKV